MAQSKVNTHGFKMVGLRKVAGLVSGVPLYSGYYLNIAWCPADGRLIYEEFVGDGSWHCDWSDTVIPCGNVWPRMTQQQIADQVANAIHLAYEVGERS